MSRPPRTGIRPHRYLPDGDGTCWCALPETNRHHVPAADPDADRTAAILGERADDQDPPR